MYRGTVTVSLQCKITRLSCQIDVIVFVSAHTSNQYPITPFPRLSPCECLCLRLARAPNKPLHRNAREV